MISSTIVQKSWKTDKSFFEKPVTVYLPLGVILKEARLLSIGEGDRVKSLHTQHQQYKHYTKHSQHKILSDSLQKYS